MSARLLDGKSLAERMTAQTQIEVQRLRQQHGAAPGLTVLMVGDNPASALYVRRKEKACQKAGIAAHTLRMPDSSSTADVLGALNQLNNDPSVHAILVQLPLPPTVNEKEVLAAVNPEKDVDGFHPLNVGRLQLGDLHWAPCTPAGVLALLEDAGISLDGLNAAVIGRSQIVGKPMAALLLARNATVTICHSHTRELARICQGADLLVAALGRPWMIDERFIKPGAIVVDVGISIVTMEKAPSALLESELPAARTLREKGSVLLGDVRGDHAEALASWLSPAPGGVGPMTVAVLLAKTVRLARMQLGLPAA